MLNSAQYENNRLNKLYDIPRTLGMRLKVELRYEGKYSRHAEK